MTGIEERSPGGRSSGSVRVGSTVRRPTGDETPAVHALLRHLEAVGFDAVGRRAREHAGGLRAAAGDGYEPAVAPVAEGVADGFDRAVRELEDTRGDLLSAVRAAGPRW